MIETPFLGDQYNYYVPGSILLLSLIFLLLSYTKYETAVVRALKRYNNEQDNFRDGENSSSTDSLENARKAISTPASELPAKEKQKLDAAYTAARQEMYSLYQGELAFLREVKT